MHARIAYRFLNVCLEVLVVLRCSVEYVEVTLPFHAHLKD